MAQRPRKTIDIFIDTRFGPSQRRAIGENAIKFIKERTSKGIGEGGKPFQQASQFQGGRKNSRTYADSYRESTEFKTAGKKPRPINMRLTGEMLDSLEVIDSSLPGRVTIGYSDAGDESDKAFFNEEKGYKFLSLTNEERDKIVRSVGSISSEDEIRRSSESFARRLARGIFGGS